MHPEGADTMTTLDTPLHTDTSPAHTWRMLASVCLASAAMPMTFTGPAVALRDIAQSLGGAPQALAWVTNAFMLAFGSCLMVAGTLADRYGRRRVFLAGVAAFVLASLALMAVQDLVVFNLLRAVQGAAGAAVFAGGAAAMAQAFEGAARLRAFSLLGTSFGMGLTLGPVAAGWLTFHLGWRAIFGLVVVCGGLAGWMAMRALRESRDPQARALDWPGALTFSAALALFTFGVLQAPERGWGHPVTLAALGGAVALAAWFVRIERRVARPMLDLSLFRYPRFVGVQLLAAAPAYGFVVLLVLLPIRFVGIEGLPATQAGSWMLALSAPLLVLPAVAGQMARRWHPATICGAGLLLTAAGLWALGGGGSGAAVWVAMAVIGIGMGLPWGLMDGLAVSVVPKERAGMATGIFSTTRVAGEGLALAVVGALLAALIARQLAVDGAVPASVAQGLAQQLAAGDLAGAAARWPAVPVATLVHAYHAAFDILARILAGITVLTAVMVFVVLGRDADVDPDADSDGVAGRASELPCQASPQA